MIVQEDLDPFPVARTYARETGRKGKQAPSVHNLSTGGESVSRFIPLISRSFFKSANHRRL